jgi:hypothetical protein
MALIVIFVQLFRVLSREYFQAETADEDKEAQQ